MAHYDIFRDQLAIRFPAHGHALWEPSPWPHVTSVGDVGYISQGRFHRLFNILLPADDPSHKTFGVPDNHEPFKPRVLEHIIPGKLSPDNFCSAGVTLDPGGLGFQAARPNDPGEVMFSCREKQGAVLSLPIQAKRENTVLREGFGKWMIEHIGHWFAWILDNGVEVDRMEDIVLVTGTDHTRSWANVAFLGGQVDACASFGVEVTATHSKINWRFSPERKTGAAWHLGPSGENLPEDQCIFIRGFRVRKRLIWRPRLRAAAGPNPDPKGNNSEPDAELIPILAVPKYRDPLHVILKYIAEERPGCDMAIVHDDDLAQLDLVGDGASLEALKPEIVLNFLRSSKLAIHEVLFDPGLSSDHNVGTADTEIVKIASLSANFGGEYSRISDSESGRVTTMRLLQSHASLITSTTDTMSWLGPSALTNTLFQVPPTVASSATVESIFGAALRSYKKQTKCDIASHPLATQIHFCDTPGAIIAVLRTQVQLSDQSQSAGEKWTKWLVPTVHVLFAFSATLGNSDGPMFPPLVAIFAGIGVLLQNVHARQGAFVDLFDHIENSFQRLVAYTEVRPTTAMMDGIVKIMIDVILILGTVTKEAGQGRTSMSFPVDFTPRVDLLAGKFVNKLVGKNIVEDALQWLDKLTQEVALLAETVVEVMTVIRRNDDEVKVLDNSVEVLNSEVYDTSHSSKQGDSKPGHESPFASASVSRNTSTQVSVELPKLGFGRQAVSSPSHRRGNSSLQKILPKNFRFITQQQQSQVTPQIARAPSRSSQWSRVNLGHGSPPIKEVSMRTQPRSKSAPPKGSPKMIGEDWAPSLSPRANSTFASSSRTIRTPVSVELPTLGFGRQAVSSPSRRWGNSSLQKILPKNFKSITQQQQSQVTPQVARAPSRSSQRSCVNLGHRSPPIKEASMRKRHRSKSAPQKGSPKMIGEHQAPSHRPRANSTFASSSRTVRTPVRAELLYPAPRRQVVKSPSRDRRPLSSSLRKNLPENFKFRILVVGKSRSGKSLLIKTVFKVDMTAASEKANINIEFHPNDNRYLIVHEFSGLDPQARDSEDLQTIRDFVLWHTEANRGPSERLHAIWVCVPASDFIAGRLGDGLKDILALRNVPVVLVITKFDVVVSQALFDSFSDTPQQLNRARDSANRMYEESCRHAFDKEPGNIPAEIVSAKPSFSDHIDNLVEMTDRFISDSHGSTRAGAQARRQRLGAVPLSWSAALRVNHDVIIQSMIEVGRNRYWNNLWSNRDLVDQSLKDCVNIIHDDIVEIWNLNDKTGYLFSHEFKARVSHLIKDLARSANGPSTSNRVSAASDYPDWAHDSFEGSPENVRCVVGYIVDLTVIMDGIFRKAAGDMSPERALVMVDRHEKSGRRDAIHRDVRSFIAEIFSIRSSVPGKDLVLERIIDLIKQHCVPTSVSG